MDNSINELNEQIVVPPNRLSNISKMSTSSFVFDNWIEYYLILMGYVIGYGSFWRFPYLVYTNGGGIFVLIFSIILLAIGIPCFYLETYFGQIIGRDPVNTFGYIHKKFQGVGWAMVCISWLLSIYYCTLLSWSFYYFFISFNNPLPWSNQGKFDDNGNKLPFINYRFFEDNVLTMSDNISELGSLDPFRVFCLLCSFLSIYICIAKGILSSSKVVYVTATAPIIIIVLLLLKGITLDGASIGIYYLIVPDLSKLFKINIWIKAANQVVYMLSLGVGATILISKYRKKSENVINSSVIIPSFTILFGMMCALVNFCFLGHLSKEIGIPIDKLPIQGSALAFVTYPAALSLLPFSNIWAILFFIMLITLGLDTQFTFNEQSSFYINKYILKPRGISKNKSSIIICCFGFIVGLLFMFDSGYHLFMLFDDYVTNIACFLVVTLECIIASYYIGQEKLNKVCYQYTNNNVPKYILNALKYYCPIVFSMFSFFSLINVLFYSNSYNVVWATLIKWFIIAFPLCLIGYFYIKYKNDEQEDSFINKQITTEKEYEFS